MLYANTGLAMQFSAIVAADTTTTHRLSCINMIQEMFSID